MKAKQCRCGVVAVHGICGNPRLFSMFIDETAEQILVDRVILDGHGGTPLDFSRSCMSKWKTQVHEAVQQMRKKTDKVIVVGHSMGCLLALEEAFQGNVDGLFLLCPPLSLHLTARMFVNASKVAFGLSKDDPVIAAAIDAWGVAIEYNPFHYYGWPARYLELLKEIRHVDGMLHNKMLSIPVEVYLSDRDESVSPKSDKHLAGQKTVKVTHLQGSTHYYFPRTAQQLLYNRFKEFIRTI